MAAVTKASDADLEMGSAMYAPQIADLVAGEDLDKLAICHIDQSDGKVYMSNATAADADAEVDGITPRDVDSGEPVTLFGVGVRFRYSAGSLTPGATYYLGTADGGLDDAATTGDAVGVAKAINEYDLRLIRDS